MVRGNFLGAAILVIIYTVYVLFKLPTLSKASGIFLLVVLNALLIILMYFAFKESRK
ncbi:MAG: hypothetical protein JSW08_03375 [archaeon]|nr:MAG: hypothetical protein JSW08_03375 [archaeon]